MIELSELLADLVAEGDDLDKTVVGADWTAPTPAAGWTVAHQIAHLAWTDQMSLLAARDADGFHAAVAEALAGDALRMVDIAAEQGAARPADELLADWRQGRAELADALARVPAGTKLPWYGPPMSPASMATARIMETWAHGADVADGLGVRREPTARIRHVAHLGVRTRNFAYLVRQIPAPQQEFRVELAGPDRDIWTWGPADAEQRVTGPAIDFCLLVTQRINRADTALVAVGADADAWLDIAQAFAGPPGEGRPKS